MKTTTFESPLMVCIEEECGPQDLFVWSSAWSDTETETETKDGDWNLQRGSTDSTDSTGEDETEEDPVDEDLKKDIRWVLFVTTFFALLYFIIFFLNNEMHSFTSKIQFSAPF